MELNLMSYGKCSSWSTTNRAKRQGPWASCTRNVSWKIKTNKTLKNKTLEKKSKNRIRKKSNSNSLTVNLKTTHTPVNKHITKYESYVDIPSLSFYCIYLIFFFRAGSVRSTSRPRQPAAKMLPIPHSAGCSHHGLYCHVVIHIWRTSGKRKRKFKKGKKERNGSTKGRRSISCLNQILLKVNWKVV